MMLAARGAIRASGAGLPYDAEVEYLESTGTQWINTGVYATENTRVKATLMTISTGNKNWFGGAASDYTGFAVNSYSSTQIEYYFGIGNGTWKRASGTDLVNRVFTLEFSKSSVSIDGVSVATPSYTSFPTQTSPITIFVRYGWIAYINGRVYSFQIYEDGVLVRDYIPVRKGAVGYLYDRVTRKLFGNAGSGDFVLGPDVVPVEYIESHGTEWIETDYIPPLNSKMEMRYKFLNTVGEALCGLGNSNPRYANYKGSSFATTYATSYYYFSTPSDNQWHDWGIDEVSHTSSLDSEIIAIANTRNAFDTTVFAKGFLVFARLSNDGTVNYKSKGQCSFLKFYDGSTLVRSFLPVRVGTEGAMMDTLTRRIYRNAGTGAFTYGDDLKYPIPA